MIGDSTCLSCSGWRRRRRIDASVVDTDGRRGRGDFAHARLSLSRRRWRCCRREKHRERQVRGVPPHFWERFRQRDLLGLTHRRRRGRRVVIHGPRRRCCGRVFGFVLALVFEFYGHGCSRLLGFHSCTCTCTCHQLILATFATVRFRSPLS